MRDPASAAPPIPFEDRSRVWPMRFLATFATALRPSATAPAFAREGTGAALVFWLLTFPILSALAGIVPATSTLLFGDARIYTIGSPTSDAVALDVARAAGLGLLTCTALLVAMGLPYVSIVRSYATGAPPATPVRALAYRSFLLPLAGCLTALMGFLLGETAAQSTLVLFQIATVIPVVLLFSSLQSAARSAAGLGPLLSLGAALVPFVAAYVAWLFLGTAITPLMPSEEELRALRETAQQIFP